MEKYDMPDKVKINGEEVILDPKNLEISEANLNSFLSEFAAKYDYFSRRLCYAQKLLYRFEDAYEVTYAKKFEFYKEQESCSDKLAEAKAKSNDEVAKAKQAMRECKHRKDLLWNYLRSMDKAHEDALNLGYNIRKEMDKLHPGIKSVMGKHSVEDLD